MTDSLRFRHVVYRNYRVWRKLLLASIVGHLLDPLFWLVGLGFGLHDEQIHAPDEFFRLSSFEKGPVAYCMTLEKLGQA